MKYKLPKACGETGIKNRSVTTTKEVKLCDEITLPNKGENYSFNVVADTFCITQKKIP